VAGERHRRSLAGTMTRHAAVKEDRRNVACKGRLLRCGAGSESGERNGNSRQGHSGASKSAHAYWFSTKTLTKNHQLTQSTFFCKVTHDAARNFTYTCLRYRRLRADAGQS